MTMIVAHLTFDVKPGERDRFIAATTDVMAASATDAGNVVYRFMADMQDQNRFYITEMWTSQAELDAHLAQPHAQTCMGILGGISTVSDVKLYSGDLQAMALPH